MCHCHSKRPEYWDVSELAFSSPSCSGDGQQARSLKINTVIVFGALACVWWYALEVKAREQDKEGLVLQKQ